MSATGVPATESELLARIEDLDDAELLEAGRYYFSYLVDAKSQVGVEASIRQEILDLGGDPDEFAESRDRLAEDSAGIVELVRFLLRVGARGPGPQRQKLAEALDGVGKKQVLIETLLVLGLATLVSLYHSHQTGGVKSKKKKIEYEITPDGHVKGSCEEETIYASQADALGQFLRLLRSLPPSKNGN